jgi:Tfp pilus assembly protein PilE
VAHAQAIMPCRARRGLTLLEVVGAAAILGILTAVILGGFSSMIESQGRQRQQLNCMEIANRLILQYIDDATAMPSQSQPILYAGSQYRWRMVGQSVSVEHARPDVAAERAIQSSLRLDRFVHLQATVWVGEESGGSREFDELVPHASLGRLIDPIGVRNPDSLENIFRDRDGAAYRRWWDELNRASTAGGRGPGSSNRSPTPSRTPSGGSRNSGGGGK